MRRVLCGMAVVVAIVAVPRPALAQQTLTEVLSFLLTNRSIATGDFAGDQQAAAATRDAIAAFLLAELTTLPLNSPASGLTYRLDPTLGVNVRSTDSFSPFFVERTLTGGRRQFSFGFGYTQTVFDNIDGRPLTDGTLVATASRLTGESQPFDAETLALRVSTRAFTLSGQIGLTDRFDVSAAVPLINISLNGQRVDTYRGSAFVQATAVASASGIGDAILRAKYNLLRRGSSGLAVAAEARLPTGDSQNLLGRGERVIVPKIIGSLERGRIAAHGQVGYAARESSKEWDYGGAFAVAASPRLTFIAEIIGRRLNSGGRLTEVTAPNPGLAGVETIRLSATTQPTSRASVVAGFRWNVASRWLLSVNVLRPLTTAGLNARWVQSVTLDYSIGR